MEEKKKEKQPDLKFWQQECKDKDELIDCYRTLLRNAHILPDHQATLLISCGFCANCFRKAPRCICESKFGQETIAKRFTEEPANEESESDETDEKSDSKEDYEEGSGEADDKNNEEDGELLENDEEDYEEAAKESETLPRLQRIEINIVETASLWQEIALAAKQIKSDLLLLCDILHIQAQSSLPIIPPPPAAATSLPEVVWQTAEQQSLKLTIQAYLIPVLADIIIAYASKYGAYQFYTIPVTNHRWHPTLILQLPELIAALAQQSKEIVELLPSTPNISGICSLAHIQKCESQAWQAQSPMLIDQQQNIVSKSLESWICHRFPVAMMWRNDITADAWFKEACDCYMCNQRWSIIKQPDELSCLTRQSLIYSITKKVCIQLITA